jgi:hypothetical protein
MYRLAAAHLCEPIKSVDDIVNCLLNLRNSILLCNPTSAKTPLNIGKMPFSDYGKSLLKGGQ